MKTIVGNREERVVYIEYNGKVPHQVYTAVYSPTPTNGIPFWCLSHHWDFFANGGDESDIRHYNSGGGGDAAKIYGPHWVGKSPGEYWMDREIAAFKNEPINGKELLKPKRLKRWDGSTSINPFNVSEETYSHEYCEVCGFESTEPCWEHNYEDNEGNLRVKHANHH